MGLLHRIVTGAFALLLLVFLGVEMAIELTQRGYARLRGRNPPPAVWTAPVQRRKWG